VIDFKLSVVRLENENQSLTTLATLTSAAPMLGMYMIAPTRTKTAKKTKSKSSPSTSEESIEQNNSEAE
jgi:hypothetical protein